MQQIDMNSDEFQAELERTWDFVKQVNTKYGFVQNPNEEVNDGVAMGLARQKLIYGKRFCPCFMVDGSTREEQEDAPNRLCPCEPALKKEIPENGSCHCGIFCTPEYAKAQAQKDEVQEVIHEHSKGLTKEQAELLLKEEQLSADQLEALIEARTLKMIDFTLLDVREFMEYQMGHIVGTDALVPTSQFYDKIEEHNGKKQSAVIVYCHTGSRSFQVQHAMKALGFTQVGNLRPGIVGYRGEIQRG
ncbi:Rubredoxin [hydrothermal vent metagenome]|uniref:Rubredoxin n=1 Tax=hydrothermal vent metagenome TaxID=652676 RepID=A0A1W1EFK4_9ZZZZ